MELGIGDGGAVADAGAADGMADGATVGAGGDGVEAAGVGA